MRLPRPPLPRSLFARLMLIWLIGISAVLAVSFALFLGERDRFDRGVLFEGVAREIATTADILDQLTPAERSRWIETMGRRRLRPSLSAPPAEARPLPARFELVQALSQALPERELTVLALPPRGQDMPHHARLIAFVTLSDGSPLSIRLQLPTLNPGGGAAGPTPLPRVLAALTALILGMSLLTWFAVRIATRPLSRLAEAAKAIGEDPNRSPMSTHGPTEVAQAAQAFNQMQQRIQEHVSERTRILAAITHDLRTPITRLRLRAEQVEDEQLRARIQSDLDAMQSLANEGMAFARSLDAPLQIGPVDLDALLEALTEDARDMGWPVSLSGRANRTCLADATALKRSLWNLVDNGIKFGERVEIEVAAQDDALLSVRIRDHGAGLDPSELDKVFEPFYRTEASRNRETGGTGLGLAIARNLMRAQGGDVRLTSAPTTGLIAEVLVRTTPGQ